MLFLASRILDYDTADEIRVLLLEKLGERGLLPFIRSIRLNCYEQALSEAAHVAEMEQAVALSTRLEDRAPYIRGDVFLFDNHIFSLVFGDSESLFTGIHAGIVYEPHISEPLRRLDGFCQNVSDCLIEAINEITGNSRNDAQNLRNWRQEQSPAQADSSVLSLVRIGIRSLRLFARKARASAYAPPSCLRILMPGLSCVAPGSFYGRLCWSTPQPRALAIRHPFHSNRLVEVGLVAPRGCLSVAVKQGILYSASLHRRHSLSSPSATRPAQSVGRESPTRR